MALHQVRFRSWFQCHRCRTEFEFEQPIACATECPECETPVLPVETEDTFLTEIVWC